MSDANTIQYAEQDVSGSAATHAVSHWPHYPTLYEINAWTWLFQLSRKHGKRIDLASVPSAEWDAIAKYGFDAVWLMGVWERSAAGIAIANRNQGLLDDFRRALPDFHSEDNVGSPYCVRRYVVDQHLGGPEGLAVARRELSQRGMNLLLDFVPNHVAPDHPWVHEHPEYFVRGSNDDARRDPASFVEIDGVVFARGRDPFFPAWPDVLQLNAFDPGLRQAAIETVSSIADQCDGVRCDMAMLFMNAIFERTWGTRAGARPNTEYWTELITAVKNRHPGFLFVAEAYWDLEWELQQLGFDFCYDKKLYDRLEHESAESVRLHLCADMNFQNKLLRFIENHDEPRAAEIFSPAQHRAAALLVATLPGIRLFHEGQFEGRKERLPVFLDRGPNEPVDHELLAFYNKLLTAVDKPLFREGQWTLCERGGWSDNASFQNLVAWNWRKDEDRCLVAINLSDHPVQARIQIPWADLANTKWKLTDMLADESYERDGNDLLSAALYVDLKPWGYHLLWLERTR